MSRPLALPRIGIVGADDVTASRSRVALWAPGYAGAVSAAGGTPVPLTVPKRPGAWEDIIRGLAGLILVGAGGSADEELCETCRERRLPFLGVDGGLHVLNTTFGGTLWQDLPRERPEALQHRHPPEPGLRHAITVVPTTWIGRLYGDGEVVVNSEHRRAVDRVARGFRISATALDGIVEAIELESDEWFAVGVQWQPASATASGLDIQLFRGFVEACTRKRKSNRRARSHAAA